MKKILILAIVTLCSCKPNGRSVIYDKEFNDKTCRYCYTSGQLSSNCFGDSCGKYDIGDTIK